MGPRCDSGGYCMMCTAAGAVIDKCKLRFDAFHHARLRTYGMDSHRRTVFVANYAVLVCRRYSRTIEYICAKKRVLL